MDYRYVNGDRGHNPYPGKRLRPTTLVQYDADPT